VTKRGRRGPGTARRVRGAAARPDDDVVASALVAASQEAFQFEAAKLSLRDHLCVFYQSDLVTRRLGSTPASEAWRRSMYWSNCGTVKAA
jgi:hypothetical protein